MASSPYINIPTSCPLSRPAETGSYREEVIVSSCLGLHGCFYIRGPKRKAVWVWFCVRCLRLSLKLGPSSIQIILTSMCSAVVAIRGFEFLSNLAQAARMQGVLHAELRKYMSDEVLECNCTGVNSSHGERFRRSPNAQCSLELRLPPSDSEHDCVVMFLSTYQSMENRCVWQQTVSSRHVGVE